jgi:hypothetical protein
MQNRRRESRFSVEGVQGRMTFASDVEILNMSLSGCAVKLDRRLNIGGDYNLKLEVDDATVPVRAKVVWESLCEVRKESNGDTRPVYSAGLRFCDLLSEPARTLLAFIDRHKLDEEKRLGGLRFHIDAPGQALLDVPVEYRVRVISLSGMLIHTDVLLEFDSRYAMEIILADGRPLTLQGRVAYSQQTDGGANAPYEIGIEFVALAPADRRRLAAYLRTLAAH